MPSVHSFKTWNYLAQCATSVRTGVNWNQYNRRSTDRETNRVRVAISFKTSTWIEKVLGEVRCRANSLKCAYLLQNLELGALLWTVESPYTYLPAHVIGGANNKYWKKHSVEGKHTVHPPLEKKAQKSQRWKRNDCTHMHTHTKKLHLWGHPS